MKAGILYYPSGEIRFVGSYDETALDETNTPYKLHAGVEFRKDGTIYREGIFQWGGLYCGRLFYPSGKLKFQGQFNDKHGAFTGKPAEHYYGPAYPTDGIFYAEDGSIIYQGPFKVMHRGSLGFPKVVIPEGFRLTEYH